MCQWPGLHKHSYVHNTNAVLDIYLCGLDLQTLYTDAMLLNPSVKPFFLKGLDCEILKSDPGSLAIVFPFSFLFFIASP